ncbi:GDSL-type esterase/lipase family protein [Actinoplanes sp. NPDC051851]|uniref:GDSL-type esterase/lipase family protein n=1 Tax=Actinoplanes sp. NPDC051851 TaxID=3154753 RepID=UPI00342DAEE6
MRRRTLLVHSGVTCGAATGPPLAVRRWAHTWTAAPQPTAPGDLPPGRFGGDLVLADTTIRQTVHLSAGGPRLRVRFSNAYGTFPLPISAAAVALPAPATGPPAAGPSSPGFPTGPPAAGPPSPGLPTGPPGAGSAMGGITPGTSRPLTFGGQRSVTVPPGAQIVSDPIPLPVADGSALTVTTYIATGQPGRGLTSHAGARTTSWLAPGDQHTAAELTGATAVDRWFLVCGVEVWTSAPGLILLGDSLTDRSGGWPGHLRERLPGVAVLNQAADGNRMLRDGPGPNALARMDRDVLGISGATWLLVFEGAGDIGTALPTEAGLRQVIADLTAAYRQVVLRAHAQDLLVYGATLTPFGGHAYDDRDGRRERARMAINGVIRGGIFDAHVDFDTTVRDPRRPDRLAPAYDSGDHLHLSPAGHRALAAAVPRELLAAEPIRS